MNRKIEIALHIAAWILIFFTPMMYAGHSNFIDVRRYLFFSVAPLMLVVVFYVNYFLLVPRYYLNNKRNVFYISNIVFIVLLSIFLHYWMYFCRTIFDPIEVHREKPEVHCINHFVFILRDMFNLLMSCIVATTIRLAEKLNNIYALTAIDATRAQKAIDELSKILRYVLYENDSDFVHLVDETNFLKNYVNLMRIRVSSNVDVKMNIDIPQDCHACIAPMIVISLVENAFKHGISASEPSYISIDIKASNDKIECEIRNSNFPKTQSDHSGHGIGLKQVAKRLELAYNGNYKWEKWTDEKEYNSKIIIYDTKLCYY